MKQNKLLNLVSAALFAALVCAATLIRIPIPVGITGGYVNIGDCFVLTAAFMLGPVYGALAAGIGSALADLIGFPLFAPGTLVIKALMAVTAYYIYKGINSVFNGKIKIISKIISVLAAEAVMVIGYFIYEALILGYGIGSASAIPGNVFQGAVGAVAAVVLVSALEKAASKSKTISSFFKAGIK